VLEEARESLRLARLRTLLFVLLLVGLPLGVSISLIAGREDLPATSGEQPGGQVRGRLVEGGGASVPGVPVWLMAIAAESPTRLLGRTTSDAEGRFTLEAEPVIGKYAVGAGGKGYRRSWRELSFLDRKGAVIDPGELELRLLPGCSLRIELVRVSDRFAASGRFELRGRARDGGPFGLLRNEVLLSEDFEGGVIELDGLPPLDGELQVFLSNGDRLMLDLALDVGSHRRQIEL
jgi:hypothetical protein